MTKFIFIYVHDLKWIKNKLMTIKFFDQIKSMPLHRKYQDVFLEESQANKALKCLESQVSLLKITQQTSKHSLIFWVDFQCGHRASVVPQQDTTLTTPVDLFNCCLWAIFSEINVIVVYCNRRQLFKYQVCCKISWNTERGGCNIADSAVENGRRLWTNNPP